MKNFVTFLRSGRCSGAGGTCAPVGLRLKPQAAKPDVSDAGGTCAPVGLRKCSGGKAGRLRRRRKRQVSTFFIHLT
ncbi:MAG: hypothetical protein IK144_04915 [Bacteroidaceae bacterium]|nr:hypothetical protein [Bacteroidaceae bacterium]